MYTYNIYSVSRKYINLSTHVEYYVTTKDQI